jgi:hypothetical protein
MLHFCTYFDSHYLPRALALHGSLQEHCSSFTLWGLCMDRLSYDFLSQMDLPALHCIRLEEVEHEDPSLLDAKRNRSTVEYYFTCTPSLPLFLLNRYEDIDRITYLDADLFCFSNPSSFFSEIKNHSISIVPHRFHSRLSHLEKRGLFNVGFLSFRRDENALSCLKGWRQQCIEWCYDREEEGRYADQKYLDSWPTRFKGVVALENKGVNLGPWNLSDYEVSYDGNTVSVEGQILLFFHFHGLREITPWLYDPNVTVFRGKLTKAAKKGVYAPYIKALRRTTKEIASSLPKKSLPSGIREREKQRPLRSRLWRSLDRIAYVLLFMLRRNFILMPSNGRLRQR